MKIEDPVEKVVAEALDKAGIRYVHEMENKDQNLDFYLPDAEVYIECKAFRTDRTAKQCDGKQVIIIQGYWAAACFAKMITKSNDGQS